jgi:hypothetical protein
MKKHLAVVIIFACLLTLAASGWPSEGLTMRTTKAAPKRKKIIKSKKPIPEEYIVVLKDEVPEWEVEWQATGTAMLRTLFKHTKDHKLSQAVI